MLCVSPTPTGRCSNTQLLGSKHCQQHRVEARRIYKKYKRAHTAVVSHNHEEMIKSEDARSLLKYYSQLHTSHTGRTQHIEEFFCEDERDRGHFRVIEDLGSKLSEVEKRLAALYQRPSSVNQTEEADTSSDTDSDTESEEWDASSEAPTVKAHDTDDVVSIPKEPSPEAKEAQMIYDKMTKLIASRAPHNEGFESLDNAHFVGLLLCFIALLNKGDELGYFSRARKMTYKDYLSDPHNIISPYRQVRTLLELKNAYRLMLMDWNNAKSIYMSLVMWSYVTETESFNFQYKLVRKNQSNYMAATPYFPLTTTLVSRLVRLSNSIRNIAQRHDVNEKFSLRMYVVVHPSGYIFASSLGLVKDIVIVTVTDYGQFISSEM